MAESRLSASAIRHVLIRDLVVVTRIGVRMHEARAPQRVRVNLDLEVPEGPEPIADKLANVVNYDDIVRAVRRVAGDGHISLVETLAERIAALCFADRRIRLARVRIEKLDVYRDVESVGISIERINPDYEQG